MLTRAEREKEMAMGRQFGTCRLDNLRAVREAAGVSIQWLARESLTSDHTINELEQRPTGGTCTEDQADRIGAALGVSLVTLSQALL
jgi:ribosome-binding protein aMBF1 (putative translation factor)